MCRWLLHPGPLRATPFFLSELFHSVPLHAVTLHTATGYPSERDVRLAVVYIPGENMLIFSRYYERVDVDSQVVLSRLAPAVH